MFTDEFIKEIPKTDLHLHLDGSLRLSTLIDLAKRDKIELPSFTEAGLREKVFKDNYKNLGEYLTGFAYTCSVLRKAENLERVAYELALDNQNEGVRYMEVRFAPQLHIDNKDLTMELVMQSVNDGLHRAKREFNSKKSVLNGDEPPFEYGIIACAMRMFGPQFSPYYEKFYKLHQYSSQVEVLKMGAMELAQAMVHIRDKYDIPIVAFDLAGQEAGYPAEYFVEAYKYIHKNFMHKTVHAGEAYGAESIFQAITDLYADRIGHCYHLFEASKITDPQITDKEAYVSDLSSFIAEKRITVEVCLTSNLQTLPEIGHIKNHAFRKMLDNKVSTTICTDNRLVSNTTVSKEIRLAVDNFPIDHKTFRNMNIYGFKRSFFHGSYAEKRKYVRQNIDYYNRIAKKHGVVLDD